MKYIFNENKIKTLALAFSGLLCLLVVACGGQRTDMSKICGEWKSVNGKPDIRIAEDGECYRLTLFAKTGLTGTMEPEIYLIQQKDGAMFIDTGSHIDMAYDEGKDMLIFSTGGEYIRKQ